MANQKITALVELVTPEAGDLLPIVDDPAGVPITKKITRANLVTGLEATANKGQASGYAGLDASSKLTGAQQVYGTGVDTACQGNDARLSPPTGTGFRHITAGTEDAAAKLVDTGDINADQVTYAKIQNVSATDKVLGRSTAGAGDVEEIACTAAGRALLDDVAASDQRTTLGLGALAVKTTVATADIDNDAVTLAKLLDIATASLLGRTTAATGDPEVLTATQATALLNAFTSALKGLVPASGGGTTNFLRADAAWAAPAGGAGPTIIVKELTADEISDEPTNTTMGKVVGLVQNVDPGTWWFEYRVIWQTNTAATAVKVGVNFSGTQTRFVVEATHGEATTAASSGAADQVHAAFGLRAGGGNRAPSTTVSIYGPISADTVSADMMVIVKGVIVVTVAGDLELYFGSEATGSTQTIESGSALRLTKVSA